MTQPSLLISSEKGQISTIYKNLSQVETKPPFLLKKRHPK